MRPSPRLSVVIPTHNRADFLAEALESVQRQTLAPHEVIVADDGSTDETPEVCAAYGVRYLRQENRGASAARNLALRHATGDAVVFLDSDDRLRPRALALLVEGWRRARRRVPDTGVVYGQGVLFNEQLNHRRRLSQPRASLDALLRDNVFVPSGSLVTRACLEEVQGFAEDCPRANDWEFWLRVALAGFRFHRLPHVLFEYRDHPSGISKSEENVQWARLDVKRRALESGRLSPRQIRQVKTSMAQTRLKLHRYQHHFAQGGPTHLREALALDEEVVSNPWFFVFGCVYAAPSLRARCPGDLSTALEGLYGLTRIELERQGRWASERERRLRAGLQVARTADALFARRYLPAVGFLLRALAQDPHWLKAALTSARAEALRALPLITP